VNPSHHILWIYWSIRASYLSFLELIRFWEEQDEISPASFREIRNNLKLCEWWHDPAARGQTEEYDKMLNQSTGPSTMSDLWITPTTQCLHIQPSSNDLWSITREAELRRHYDYYTTEYPKTTSYQDYTQSPGSSAHDMKYPARRDVPADLPQLWIIRTEKYETLHAIGGDQVCFWRLLLATAKPSFGRHFLMTIVVIESYLRGQAVKFPTWSYEVGPSMSSLGAWLDAVILEAWQVLCCCCFFVYSYCMHSN